MKTVFLADAHLHNPGDANYLLLLRFLEQLQGNTATLCILGDLFDFRIGLPALDFPEQEPLLDALKRLNNSGTRLVYLEGNHDFHLGSGFADQIGAELHAGPVHLNLDGKRIYLCHGDLVNPEDWRYRMLYHALRNRATVMAGRLIPAALVQGLRRRLQRSSRGRYVNDSVRWDYGDIIRSFASKIRLKGYDAVVLGHFHLPFIEQDKAFTLLSLGDWIGQFSYGQYENGEFSLLSFSALPSETLPEMQLQEHAPIHP